ncbi:hypothetical protein KAR91_57860 [Candidatus Pacearchaeota archaeon]|nr:hypothetical protein [Candidatus Pacearchaeota archaeon]
MNTKNLMVFMVMIASVLLLVSTVSASTDLVSVDLTVINDGETRLIAGETIEVEVWFTANMSDRDVTVTATLDTGREKVEATTAGFRVAENESYKKTLILTVPNELKDELTGEATLEIEFEGKDGESVFEYTLTVERAQYDSVVKSITVANNVEAGETIPVEFVVKNTGFYDLDDTYVTVSIAELGIEKSMYLGDIFALEGLQWSEEVIIGTVVRTDYFGDEDNEDTMSGTLYLAVPYTAKAGVYSVDVEVSNDDLTINEVKEIVISNDFSAGNVIVPSSSKTAATGENTEYSLVIVNPTNKLKVYTILAESSESISSTASTTVIAVPAGTSKTVKVSAVASTEGEHAFSVAVTSGDLTEVVALSLNAEGKSISAGNPVVVLTIILAIIFLVLLVVLIVLLGKKPEKAEEFGESYY